MKQNLFNKLWLRVGMIVAIMTTALSGTVWADTVTYAVTSTSAVSTSGTAPTGSSASYSSTYNTACQLTKNNSMTLMLSGYEGYKITGITLSMKSNSKGGSGSLSVTAGSTDIASISTAAFNTASWYGAWSTSYVDVTVSMDDDSYEIQADEDVVITIAATANSLYCESFTLTYEEVTGGGSGLTASDLAITDAPVALSFDLYNNASAQTVSFTSSSTGAVTVNGGTGYVTTSVSGNTITVTPVAVTPSAQTITVSQEADATYNAGSKTFTVSVTDSTPFAGGDVTFDATTETGTSPLVKNGVTFACNNGVLNNGSEYRLYKNSVTTFSVSEGTITQIAFTGTSSNPASGFATQTGWTTDGNDGTWIGNASSVSFTASGAQVRATEIVVTVDMSATPDPVINADNVNIAYNDEDGEIAYTISYSVSGGSIVASETASWLEVDDVAQSTTTGTIEFICDPNSESTARSAEVTLTYTYNTNETVTKIVTITQGANPNISTIPALFAAATTTATEVSVTFNNWVVSGVSTNGKNVFVTDNSGNGFVIYNSEGGLGSTYAVGNILSGTISCSLKKNAGYAQLTGVSGLTITTGGTITTSNIALASLAGANTGALVSYEGLTCSVDDSGSTPKYYLSDGTTTLQVYTSLYAFGDALVADKTYNITGIYEQYNSTKEILPRSAADIEEYVAPQHTVSFSVNGVVTSSEDVSEGAAITFPADPADINGKTFMGWTTEAITGTTDTAPTMMTSATMGTTDETYYAVFATASGSGGSGSVTLTAVQQTTTGYADRSLEDNMGNTWTAYCAAQNQSGTYYYNLRNNANEDSYVLSPAFGGNITSIKLVAWNGSSTEDRTFSVKSSDGETEYGTIAVPKNGKPSAELTATLGSTSFNQFKLKASAALGFHYITVTYGSVSYSGYCTTVAPATVPVTVTDAGYATYCSENALDFTDTEIKAYVGTKNGDKLTFTSINQVPANTGMLLVYAGGKTENVPVIASATAVEDNCLVGVNAETTISSTDYILNKVNDGVGFYKAGSYTTLGAHKAYIPAAVGNGVKGFAIDFDDDATGISLMEDGRSQMEDGVIYNVAGQRIQKMQKGINIVNGKKILK